MQRLVRRALSLEGLVLQSERGLPSASGVSRGSVSMGWAGDLSFEKRCRGRGGGLLAEGRPHARGFQGAPRARRWLQVESPIPPRLSV